tara:strand:+ start:7464 stop:8387 length:924 start_codon:yes stop_codon:yes gene_type:complete
MYYFTLSLILTIIFIKINLNFFKKNIISIPNKRSLHKIPKPNGGGIIFAIITSLFGLLTKFYLPLYGLPLSILGLLDDKYNLKANIRFSFQVISVYTFLLISGNKFLNLISNSTTLNIFLVIFILIFSVGIINIFNFMDGIDGLVCGSTITIFIFIILKYKLLILIPFVGSLAGFLFFNWSPSKIFMGDSGSLFIGMMYIIVLSLLPNIFEIIKVLIISFPIIGDGFICLVRRYLANKNIFEAHKDHLYQRLLDSGMKHSTVSLIYIISIIILGTSFLQSNTLLTISTILIIFFGIYLEKYKAIKFE